MSSPGSGPSSNRGPRHTEVCVLPIAKHKRFHLIIHDFNIQHIPSSTTPISLEAAARYGDPVQKS